MEQNKTENEVADDVCSEIKSMFIDYAVYMRMEYDYEFACEKSREIYDEIENETGKRIDIRS